MASGERYTDDAGRITCQSCQEQWPEWMRLLDEERQRGRQPIWVDVDRNKVGVRVAIGILDWPARRTVIRVANAAVIEHFGFSVTYATEGGVEGLLDDEPIELRNFDDKIGLFDEHQFPDNPGCQRILEWYGGLMRVLFENVLVVNGQNLGRGRILKLDSSDPDYQRNVHGLLWLTLYAHSGQADFPERVFGRLRELDRGFAGSYLAGLTDAEIVAFYVPPPGLASGRPR
ncbi:MAG: hypothetical protein HYY50_03985 [Candidatus Kerfeldbacteria bacterium]|nr:hypothetical protein [Candidatus Kerfeldbacteria bacterium]